MYLDLSGNLLGVLLVIMYLVRWFLAHLPTPGTPVPGTPRGPLPGDSGSSQRAVPECCLPGGHCLPHFDAGGNKFVYDNRKSTAIPIEESGNKTSDHWQQQIRADPRMRRCPTKVTSANSLMLLRTWATCLSKKMMDKGREVSWSSLSLNQKKEFDASMAKEISNVLRNCPSELFQFLAPE